MKALPTLLTSGDVARLLSTPGDPWSTRRARRWLLSTGAGEVRSGRMVTTRTKLMLHFPEAFGQLAEAEERQRTGARVDRSSAEIIADLVARVERIERTLERAARQRRAARRRKT